MNQQQIIDQVKVQGILPLFYHESADTCLSVVKALYGAGIRSVEFTNRGSKAFENFSVLVKEKPVQFADLLLGIGTIKSAEEATAFINAGADFLVSPYFDQGACDTAKQHDMLWIPGCMTTTEIHYAQLAGCTLVKLFPGNLLQPSFVDAISPLFSGMSYMVTGGVDTTSENISAWFKTGVAAVGMGSKLITKELLQQNNFHQLEAETKKIIEIVKSLRQ